MMYLRYAIFFVFICLMLTCRKDETLVDDPVLVNVEEPILLDGYDPPFESVTASVYGQIKDENGNLMEGVTIKVLEATIQTDENGFFTLGNIEMNAEGTLIVASKDGYVSGSRTIYPKTGENNRISIKLIPKVLTDRFRASDGSTTEVEGGATIKFEPNGIVYAGGGSYDGFVNVYAKFLDPTINETLAEMPGDLAGIRPTDDYSNTGLKSYGMLMVELYSDDDRKLQLAKDFPAEIVMPIPQELEESAPETIPLWYFNDDVAKWVEEGEATLQDGKYVGKVTHFSFWNCDIPVDATKLKVTFEDENGEPINGLEVFIKAEGSGIGTGFTDENGCVSGIVPANENLTIIAAGIFEGELWSEEIGVIVSPTELSYTIDFSEFVDLKRYIFGGHLTCNGQDVENAVLILESDFGTKMLNITEQPFLIFSFTSESESYQKLKVINLDDESSTQDIIMKDDWTYNDLQDYEMCNIDEDEYFMIQALNGQVWDAEDVSMWRADFVSPSTIHIDGFGFDQIDFELRLNIHDPQGVGDYTGMYQDGPHEFSKCNVSVGFETGTFWSGAPEIFNVLVFEETGHIVGEFSGILRGIDSNQNESGWPLFGRFKVKYEEPNLDGSYVDFIANDQRVVVPGHKGFQLSGAFITDAQSAGREYFMRFNGDSVGSYPDGHQVIYSFLDIDFGISTSDLDDFIVTDYNGPGGLIKGYYEGQAINYTLGPDSDPVPIYGSFSILNE